MIIIIIFQISWPAPFGALLLTDSYTFPHFLGSKSSAPPPPPPPSHTPLPLATGYPRLGILNETKNPHCKCSTEQICNNLYIRILIIK